MNEFELDFDFDALIEKEPKLETIKEPEEKEEVDEVEVKDTKEETPKKEVAGFFENEFEEKEVSPSDDIKEESSDSEESLGTYAAALKEAGVLPNINIKEFNKLDAAGKADYLLTKQNEEIEERLINSFNDWLEELPPTLKHAIEHYTEGASLESIIKGVDNLERYQKINVDSLDKNEELANRLIIEEKLALGYSQEDAEEELENITDKTKAAKKSLNKLIQIEEDKIEADKKQKELRIKQEEANTQKLLKSIESEIYKAKELIPGVPLNDKIKKLTFENLTKPVAKTKDGRLLNAITVEREKDPQSFELKVAHLFTITKGFKDFNIFTNLGKTNAIKELEKSLERNDYNKGKGSSYSPKKNDIESEKEMRDFFRELI